MSDINYRQPKQIFRIWLCGDNIIIVRNKFCMHTGLFTHVYNIFQLMILINTKSYGYLINSVLRKNNQEIINTSDDFYALILRTSRLMVVQNPSDGISPFRICHYPVNILLRSTAVTNQNHMLLIVSVFSNIAEKIPDQIS